MVRLEKRPKAGACSSGRIRAGLRPRLLRRRRVPPRRIRICTFCAAPPWRGSPAVAPSPSSSGQIRTCLFHRGRIVVPESSSALVPPPSVDPLRPDHLPCCLKLPPICQALARRRSQPATRLHLNPVVASWRAALHSLRAAPPWRGSAGGGTPPCRAPLSSRPPVPPLCSLPRPSGSFLSCAMVPW